MAASFLLIVHSLIYVVNSMDWSNIWTDDCDTQGSWACHHDGNGMCLFGERDTRCENGRKGICHRVCQNASIQSPVPISAGAGRPLRLSLYVHLQLYKDSAPNDRCRIWFAYDDDNFNINEPDWECGSPCDGTQTIDIPSTGQDTLGIALGVYDKYHTHCW
eukprot:273693_1